MVFSISKAKIFIFVAIAISVAAYFGPDNASDSAMKLKDSPTLPILTVYKSKSCNCCGKWAEHIEANHFKTAIINSNNLFSLKVEKGIPTSLQSCHTAVSSEGYVFEGHVPAKYIAQFLAQKPADAIGLTVPAMPLGSPGMEQGDNFMPYGVLLLMADGTTSIYANVATQKEQY